MKKLIYLSLLILPILSSCQSTVQKEEEKTQTTGASYLVLAPTEFNTHLNKEELPQLIDVRTSGEFNEGTINNAMNYDLLDGTFEKQMGSLDKNKTVFVFCARGRRSGQASELLKQNGFTKIVDLEGGYTAWSNTNE